MEDQKVNTVREEKQVPCELGQLDYSIERLDKTIHMIAERLACVLRSDKVKPGEEKVKDVKPLVEIAQSIKAKARCIDNLNEKLGDIIAGLEI